jgi:hypothetical protein
MKKPAIERYQSVIEPSSDNGYVIGVFNQKTGECEQAREEFSEVDELNRLYEENKALKKALKKALQAANGVRS